jgi:hypothetical protein
MAIGSFLELDLHFNNHLYSGDDVAMLNSARAGIWHACRVYGVKKVHIPYYECYTVADFLRSKGIEIFYYHIDNNFNPQTFTQEPNSAVVLVNYFGLKSDGEMARSASAYSNVIIDNAQAFFAKPLDSALNIYSPRKFVGVPDGCYVVGDNARMYVEEYAEDHSSDTASFLFKRIEYGCENSYKDRMENEQRIDNSDICRMSTLSKAILGNAPYTYIASRRKENFDYAKEKFRGINMISDWIDVTDSENVPFVYPLVVKDLVLVEKLAEKKIFTGRWWKYLLDIVPESSFEHLLSSYMVPIPIDQRYGREEIDYIYDVLINVLETKNNKTL